MCKNNVDSSADQTRKRMEIDCICPWEMHAV